MYSFVQKKNRKVKPETEIGYLYWVDRKEMQRLGGQEQDSRQAWHFSECFLYNCNY